MPARIAGGAVPRTLRLTVMLESSGDFQTGDALLSTSLRQILEDDVHLVPMAAELAKVAKHELRRQTTEYVQRHGALSGTASLKSLK